MKKFILPIVLFAMLVFLTANALIVPALADSASCESGGCSCTCSGSACRCEASGGSCTCRCPGSSAHCDGD